MILNFTFSNFRAFRETQTLSFDASKADKSLDQNCFAPDLPGTGEARFVKAVALYGANASGKSSVIDALKFLSKWVATSASILDPDEEIEGLESFALAPDAEPCPTAFAITFVTLGIRFEYRVAAFKNRIIHESLRSFPKGKPQIWYSRDIIPESELYSWKPERPVEFQPDPKKQEYTMPNVLFLSKAVSLGDIQLEPVFRWFKDGIRFFDLSVVQKGMDNEFTVNHFVKGGDLVQKVISVIKHADIGIVDAEVPERTVAVNAILDEIFEKIPVGERNFDRLVSEFRSVDFDRMIPEKLSTIERPAQADRIRLVHRAKDGKSVQLPWKAESAGTRRLFTLAGPLLDSFGKGQVVCIDELDCSMHPKIVSELLKMVFCNQANQGGAQVVFSTHNPLLLDSTLLRRDQIWFTEKDENGESHLYPLSDYSPRPEESWVRGYMSGRYGAVPYIPRGLFVGVDQKDQVD